MFILFIRDKKRERANVCLQYRGNKILLLGQMLYQQREVKKEVQCKRSENQKTMILNNPP
jgi:hypothetical protein